MTTTSPSRGASTFEFRSILLFAGVGFLQSARLDGWGSAAETLRQQLMILPFTVVFLTLIALNLLGRTDSVLPRRWLRPLGFPLQPFVLALLAMELLHGVLLLVVQGRYFRHLGYTIHLPSLAALFLGCAAIVAFIAKGRGAFAPRLLLGTLACYLLLMTYSLHFFPLTTMRADNMPLIAAACRDFLTGHFPYHLYTPESGPVVLTYLPLTWLMYLPFEALHVDVRWGSVWMASAAICIVYFSLPQRRRTFAAALLSLFLVLPYSLYQHEVYTSVQWLLFAIAFALVQRGRWLWMAAVFGLGVAASQFFWIATPFLLLYLLLHRGWRRTCAATGILFATAAVVIVPFYFHDPAMFVYCTLTHWGQSATLGVRGYNFTYWIHRGLRLAGMESFQNGQRVQAALLAVLFVAAARQKITSVAHLWRWIAAAFVLFTLTNFLSWAYFYVTAFFVMILGLLATAREHRNDGSDPSELAHP